jgi:hypothetical protein
VVVAQATNPDRAIPSTPPAMTARKLDTLSLGFMRPLKQALT